MKFNEELKKMQKQVGNIKEEQHSLAYELLIECRKKAKRDFCVILILTIMLFASNMIWLWYTNQFDYTSEETTIDSGNGIATYLENSESGDINYGND